MMDESRVIGSLRAEFPDLTTDEFREQTRIVVPLEKLYAVLEFLKEQAALDYLIDVTCVDYLHYPTEKPDRFGLVYLLANSETNVRLTVRCYVGGPEPTVPSAVSLWEAANWLEREVWDLFGIRFTDHPDLRRIVLPEPFSAHPLRKDYPLQGRGERHNFPVVTRKEE
ncbi:MAG: NADH-quinone oxidoreductase subunit C [Pirellulales bacterium]|nr:NADH-quinone oxidoreductase subunit C [Pirellulales bacterium]